MKTKKIILKEKLITDFELLKETAIINGKIFIIRNDLGYELYADGYQTRAGKLLKEHIIDNNYKWIKASDCAEASEIHGNTGIIVFEKTNETL